jgi:prepilin-type N-terminal cleavage/methylation domain-containing protein
MEAGTNYKRSAQAGFTLVEIAIVLVIIGLLLGGILKGQEMITQAKIKNLINDFNGVTAAVNSYQDRYRALAGDDLQAATRWASITTVAAGNGDGVWTCSGGATAGYKTILTAAPTAADECNLFWQHLRLGGFVQGATQGAAAGQQPSNAVNGITGVETGSGAATLGFASNMICTTNLPDKVAIAVETNMDDGVYNTGVLRGIKQTGPNPDLRAQATTDAYIEDGVSQWTICKNL